LQVTNQEKLSTTASIGALTKNTSLPFQSPLIWYPFDTDDKNAVADRFHATTSGVTKTDDARGKSMLAYQFTSGQNIIYTTNDVDLNFADAVSLSCWVKCEQLGSERFIISHGSWQQRYKLSITPEGRLRWTVKTSAGVSDLDGSAPIDLNRYYHVTAVYTGYSMELYVDGILDTFKAFSGAIQPSTKPLTIGRMDNVETQYALLGSVDEFKLWNSEIPVAQIVQLKQQWAIPAGIHDNEITTRIYPNPAQNIVNVEINGTMEPEKISLYRTNGTEVPILPIKIEGSAIRLAIPETCSGLYVLKIIMKNGWVITKKIIIR
jgi:hypothetical protein